MYYFGRTLLCSLGQTCMFKKPTIEGRGQFVEQEVIISCFIKCDQICITDRISFHFVVLLKSGLSVLNIWAWLKQQNKVWPNL